MDRLTTDFTGTGFPFWEAVPLEEPEEVPEVGAVPEEEDPETTPASAALDGAGTEIPLCVLDTPDWEACCLWHPGKAARTKIKRPAIQNFLIPIIIHTPYKSLPEHPLVISGGCSRSAGGHVPPFTLLFLL